MKDNTIKACVAMACVTIIEVYAVSQGIDGVGLAAVVAALTGLGGYAIGKKTTKPETKTDE